VWLLRIGHFARREPATKRQCASADRAESYRGRARSSRDYHESVSENENLVGTRDSETTSLDRTGIDKTPRLRVQYGTSLCQNKNVGVTA